MDFRTASRNSTRRRSYLDCSVYAKDWFVMSVFRAYPRTLETQTVLKVLRLFYISDALDIGGNVKGYRVSWCKLPWVAIPGTHTL